MTAIIKRTSIDGQRAGKDSPRRLINVAVVLLILSFVLFLFQILNLNAYNAKASGLDSLPVSIRAESQADYSQDPRNYVIPPISENILNQIITDFPATGSPQDRMGTLQAVLSSPVPTMTPDPRLPATFTPTLPLSTPAPVTNLPTSTTFTTPPPTATRYVSPTPTVTYSYSTYTPPASTSTKTPKPATRTSTPSSAATSTLTQTLPATFTVTPSSTPTMTLTSSPTNTFTPTPSQTPSSTATNTAIQTPTPTNIATATATPTNTPGPACASITNSSITVSMSPPNQLLTTLTNNTGSVISLTSVSITNDKTLVGIDANTGGIWNGSDNSLIKVISSWSGNSSLRDIAASGGTNNLIFYFQEASVAGVTTSFEFNFDNGCTLTANYP